MTSGAKKFSFHRYPANRAVRLEMDGVAGNEAAPVEAEILFVGREVCGEKKIGADDGKLPPSLTLRAKKNCRLKGSFRG